MTGETDVAVVGAGAAGLMAAIRAGRDPERRAGGHGPLGGGPGILLLDGATRLGAKILVSGGGRCNLTHEVVNASDYAGSSVHAIRRVLLQFDVQRTVAFFEEMGVALKREEGGKVFPVGDSARSVLQALLRGAFEAGVSLLHPWRVERIRREGERFHLLGPAGEVIARRVVLATGGKSLPRSGSDGAGLGLAQSLGHGITPRVFPALVPLTLPAGHFLRGLSGLTVPVTLELRAGGGRKLAAFTDSMLCTHFGISGPCVLDMSRHYLDAVAQDPGVRLTVNWLPGETRESLDGWLRGLGGRSPVPALAKRMPERLARALAREAGLDRGATGAGLTRELRTALIRAVLELRLPISGDRGFRHAEVTAGGVPLSEVHLESMESRVCPGLYLCGEMLDVDGRIGGYNFQWAWASGHVAGRAVRAAFMGGGAEARKTAGRRRSGA